VYFKIGVSFGNVCLHLDFSPEKKMMQRSGVVGCLLSASFSAGTATHGSLLLKVSCQTMNRDITCHLISVSPSSPSTPQGKQCWLDLCSACALAMLDTAVESIINIRDVLLLQPVFKLTLRRQSGSLFMSGCWGLLSMSESSVWGPPRRAGAGRGTSALKCVLDLH